MTKIITFILSALDKVGEWYKVLLLGLVMSALTTIISLICGLSLWSAIPIVAIVALILSRSIVKVRSVKLSRAEGIAYVVGILAAWMLLTAGYIIR